MENNNHEKDLSDIENIKKLDQTEAPEKKISENKVREIVSDIKNTYKNIAESIFEEHDPLRQKIIDYFVNRPDSDDEYLYILSKMSDSEKAKYATNLKESLTNNPSEFISKMERYFSTQSIYEKEKEFKGKSRVATPEEYSMGVYEDFLEPQVKDAVLSLTRKGYKTFQSGYSEKEPRNQFVDLYNANIVIPDDLKDVLSEMGVEVVVQNFDDRTTVKLLPIDQSKVIRQEEWKKIWNKFAEDLPEADPTLAENFTEPTLHQNFRKVQDIMRELKK